MTARNVAALSDVEVMIVNQGKPNRSTAEVAGLSEVVGGENDAIRRLDGWVADLRALLPAKAALSDCTSIELGATITFHSANGGSPA